jgi:hypothetical protein
MSALLHQLLDAQLPFAPEYLDGATANTDAKPPGGGAYASHRPMALQALASLGASDAQLQAFLDQQPPIPLRARWPALDAAEQRLRLELQQQGAGTVLARLLPERLAHAGAVAFHGLIRTAHAWESGHPGELALAMAWWLQRDQPLPVLHVNPQLHLADWWAALLALPAPEGMPQDWIAQRMQAWVQTPGFIRIAPQLRLEADGLQQLAALALRAYADSGNFTILHLVTASRALQVLGPFIPPEACDAALRDFSLHAAAGLLASRWRGSALATLPPWDWPALLTAACASSHDHSIKLVHAARHWQQQGLDDTLCRSAATRALHKA